VRRGWALCTVPTMPKRRWGSSRWPCSRALRPGHSMTCPTGFLSCAPLRRNRARNLELPFGFKSPVLCHVRRHSGRRLAYHPHARPEDGEVTANPRFAAETSSAAVIWIATILGFPISTTPQHLRRHHGRGRRPAYFSAIKWTVVERMVWTMDPNHPASGFIAYLFVRSLFVAGDNEISSPGLVLCSAPFRQSQCRAHFFRSARD